MEQPKSFVVWEIIYPFLLFEAVVLIIQEALVKLLKCAWAAGLAGQAISTIFAIVVLWYRFIYKEEIKLTHKTGILDWCKSSVMAVVTTVVSGVGVNLLVLSIQMLRTEEQFQAANQYLYGSSLWIELVTLTVITPVAEELLFRGIIYRKLRKVSGAFASIVISSLFFGIYHLNITQMIYASVLGFILALLMEAYKDIRIPMIGHMVVNLVVVLNGELGFLDRTILSTPFQKTGCMVICLALMICFAGVLGRKCKE